MAPYTAGLFARAHRREGPGPVSSIVVDRLPVSTTGAGIWSVLCLGVTVVVCQTNLEFIQTCSNFLPG